MKSFACLLVLSALTISGMYPGAFCNANLVDYPCVIVVGRRSRCSKWSRGLRGYGRLGDGNAEGCFVSNRDARL